MDAAGAEAALSGSNPKALGFAGGYLPDIVVGQDAERGAFHVVVLAVAQRPKERRKPGQPERQRNRHQIDQHIHDARLARKALRVTSTDEPAIAPAALSGATPPPIATV